MPIITPSSGGGAAAPTTREQIFGTTNVANGADTALAWTTSFGPNSLFDLTAPTAPTAKAAGVYAVTISITPAAMTVGGQYSVVFDLDLSGEDPEITVSSPAATATFRGPTISVAMTYLLPLNSVAKLLVRNRDGSIAIDFSLLAVVQRLS